MPVFFTTKPNMQWRNLSHLILRRLLRRQCSVACEAPTPLSFWAAINLLFFGAFTSQESTHQTPKRSWSLRLVRIKKNFKSSRRVFAYSKPAQSAEIFLAVEKSQPFNSSKTLAKAMLRCERKGFLFASFWAASVSWNATIREESPCHPR